MASVPVDFATTQENMNYARLCHLLVDVGSSVFRDTFDSIHPPSKLHTVLSSPSVSSTLHSLREEGILSPYQLGKLFPADGLIVSSANFDFALLMELFRNICGLSPPVSTGSWGMLPDDSDTSVEANIERINFYRIEVIGHNVMPLVEDRRFNVLWEKISTAILALASRTNKYTMYATSISQLKTEYMDPAAEAPFLKVWIDQWRKDYDSLKKVFEELKGMLIDPFAGGHLEFYCSEDTVNLFLYLRQWDMEM